MGKPTRATLQKIEQVYHDLGYQLRYEKGNFQSGYCLVEDRKIAIINKFFDIEGRINCLLDLLSTFEINPQNLSEDSIKIYRLYFPKQRAMQF